MVSQAIVYHIIGMLICHVLALNEYPPILPLQLLVTSRFLSLQVILEGMVLYSKFDHLVTQMNLTIAFNQYLSKKKHAHLIALNFFPRIQWFKRQGLFLHFTLQQKPVSPSLSGGDIPKDLCMQLVPPTTFLWSAYCGAEKWWKQAKTIDE